MSLAALGRFGVVACGATDLTAAAFGLRVVVLRALGAIAAVVMWFKRVDSFIITTQCTLVFIFVTLCNKKDQFINCPALVHSL